MYVTLGQFLVNTSRTNKYNNLHAYSIRKFKNIDSSLFFNNTVLCKNSPNKNIDIHFLNKRNKQTKKDTHIHTHHTHTHTRIHTHTHTDTYKFSNIKIGI